MKWYPDQQVKLFVFFPGYDDLTQTPDFTKTAYGLQQGQAKVSGSGQLSPLNFPSIFSLYPSPSKCMHVHIYLYLFN